MSLSMVNSAEKDKHTKRSVLRTIASIYDPLGWLAPVVVKFKMFFQLLCIQKIGWDESLTDELVIRWLKLLQIAKEVCFNVPRYYFCGSTSSSDDVIMHGFCDASQKASAAFV